MKGTPMKKSLVWIVCLLCFMTSAPLEASPLYGGCNGESQLWTDVFFFGIDDQSRWWVRIPVDVVAGYLRLIFKYESTGVVSAEIAGSNIPNFSGGGDFLFGSDTSGLFWTEYSEAGSSGGSDSNGNSWTEQILFAYFGTGSDNNDHLWGFVTYTYEYVLPLRAGINLSFFLPEPEPSVIIKPSRTNPFTYEEGLRVANFPTALSLDDALKKKVETLTIQSLNLESLLTFADEEIFTQERRQNIEHAMNGLICGGHKVRVGR